MVRISIEGQGATLEEAAKDLGASAIAFIKRAQEHQEGKTEALATTPDPKAPEAPKTPAATKAEPAVGAKMVNQARDQAVAYAERNGGKALQKLLAEFKIKRVSELAKADYPRWIEATAVPTEAEEAEDVVEGEDLLK